MHGCPNRAALCQHAMPVDGIRLRLHALAVLGATAVCSAGACTSTGSASADTTPSADAGPDAAPDAGIDAAPTPSCLETALPGTPCFTCGGIAGLGCPPGSLCLLSQNGTPDYSGGCAIAVDNVCSDAAPCAEPGYGCIHDGDGGHCAPLVGCLPTGPQCPDGGTCVQRGLRSYYPGYCR
jgi:hypothetical protein